ncbi:MAG: tetratricopeptide repeat-containing protein [Pacificimonas sp.]
MLVFAILGAHEAFARWHVAETEKFRVFSEGDTDDLRRRTADLERFDALLRMFTGVEPDAEVQPFEMIIAKSQRNLRRHTSASGNILGFYKADPRCTIAFSVERASMTSGDIVLFHEYAHHFLYQHFPYGYPSWYIEGFAEYWSTAEFSDRSVTVGEYELIRAQWLPLALRDRPEKWFAAVPDIKSGEDGAKFYAMSWLFTHYLFRSDMQDQLRAYLRAVAAGEDDIAALKTHLGMTPREIRTALRRYVKRKEMTRSQISFTEPLFTGEVRITALPEAADDLFLPARALACGTARDNLDDVLSDLRKAARDEDGPYAARLVAMAEAESGNAAAAITQLTTLLADAPADAELLYALGRAHSRQAHVEAADIDEQHALARGAYARAFKVRPDHYQTLYFYALDGDSIRGDAPRELLWRARELAPQVMQTSLYLAWSLAADGDLETARNVLAPVAANPHFTDEHPARILLALIETGDANIATMGEDIGVSSHEGNDAADD